MRTPYNKKVIVKCKVLVNKTKGAIIVDTKSSKEEYSEVVAVSKDLSKEEFDINVGDMVHFPDNIGEKISCDEIEEGYEYKLVPYHSLKYKE